MTSEFDKYSQSYSEDIDKVIGVFGQKHDFFIRAKADLLRPILASLGDASQLRILDVGCGVGLLHPYLVDAVGQLEGADVSSESLKIARSKNPRVRYSAYDGEALPYPAASFDCAFAVAVMHHVPPAQWTGFLSEMRRVVRPGGLVVIIEHNPFNPATRWVVSHAPMDEHAVLLSARQLDALMRSAGILRRSTRYIMLTPFAGKIFRFLDRLLARLPLGAQYVTIGKIRS